MVEGIASIYLPIVVPSANFVDVGVTLVLVGIRVKVYGRTSDASRGAFFDRRDLIVIPDDVFVAHIHAPFCMVTRMVTPVPNEMGVGIDVDTIFPTITVDDVLVERSGSNYLVVGRRLIVIDSHVTSILVGIMALLAPIGNDLPVLSTIMSNATSVRITGKA